MLLEVFAGADLETVSHPAESVQTSFCYSQLRQLAGAMV